MKLLYTVLLFLLSFLFLIAILLIGVILLPIALPIAFISNFIDDFRYGKFIRQLEGKSFLCYNNRNDLKEYVEKIIIPSMPQYIEIVYLDGRHVRNETYDTNQLSTLIYKFEKYSKFPHLFKVRNGMLYESSINNEVYNSLNMGKDVEEIFQKMKAFFEIQE